MNTAFVVLAAGKGRRLGGQPKQFRLLGGKPVIRYSLDLAQRLRAAGLVGEIAAVLPEGAETELGFSPDVNVLTGGATRSMSVLNALKACSADFVLLHDAARPFVDFELCCRLLAACEDGKGVVPLLPEANALKRVENGVMKAVDRDGLYVTQTPQLFPREELKKLLQSSGGSYKDEAELWLQSGRAVNSVEGDAMNFKITGEGDWQMAQRLVSGGAEFRTGLGYDVHPLVPGRKLVLGGVAVPSRLGLDGHSDADVLCHACADALLSAAGLPDIGTLYPASDEKYKDARSTELFLDALRRVKAQGWRVDWLSAVVTAQTPRLAPWKAQIVASMENLLGAKTFSVTFKSGEAVGSTGRGEAFYVWAAATLRR
ncbi:MAG: 2-C-methyl-D-erythritol 2,4-cyclodiphosphate synthase [Pyramidobacter sp.]|jgi:2-C-methyl-D-erythritol 4-phosphate cytidylyltransferase/2-C-methyl-D-erythritol 2,4-cyclodiphosphate synthase